MKTTLLIIWVLSIFNHFTTNDDFDKQNYGEQRIIERSAKNTVTPVLLNKGDKLEFKLKNGQIRTLQLIETHASIMRTNVKDFYEEYDLQGDGATICEFSCKVIIDGHEMTMQRYLPTQESFYEPYVVNGMRIWFDAAKDYFQFFHLKHGWCEPRADARFAVSDATDPVAPGLSEWYPFDQPYIDVNDSYLGGDVWMGSYLGVEPHGGLDINTPKGTPLKTPVEITENDDQWLEVGFEPKPYYYAATWTAKKYWPNNSEWTLILLHLNKYLVKEHTPVKKGTLIAEAAGTGVGAEEHTHFEFMIRDEQKNTVDDKVMMYGNIVSELGDEYEIVVNGKAGKVPKSSALYIRRDDRPADFSIFMVSKQLAEKNNFNYEIPQILLDPWYLIWQMFENYKTKNEWIKAHISPVMPSTVGETVSFSSKNSQPGLEGNELSYYWTFGDGCISNEKNPKHIFTSAGIFPVTLLVDDGIKKASYTQHITINDGNIDLPALSLDSPREPSFNKRKDFVMDVYGSAKWIIPHTLEFSARKTNRSPEEKIVKIINSGGGELKDVKIQIMYEDESGWASVNPINTGNEQQLVVKVNSKDISPGYHKAIVKVSSDNAINSPQNFIISLEVCLDMASKKVVVVDNESQGFYATPYFWVGGKFKRWSPGYNSFYLTNGGRSFEGEYVRFTPELIKGKYKVSFTEETPFSECNIKILIHHAAGDTILWIDPLKTRNIGEFDFNSGKEGFVQLFAEGSKGEVIADAIRFSLVDQ